MIAVTELDMNTGGDETEALAHALRGRDPEVIDLLIERYQYRLFRYLLSLTGDRQTAEDVFQETWIRVLERGYQYNGKSKFEPWLFCIARNLVIDRMRRKKPLVSLESLTDSTDRPGGRELAASKEISPVESLVKREEKERVAAGLGYLPALLREVLVLRFQEDLMIDEIAAVVSAPLSTVKSRLYRGLEALRQVLEGGTA
jgi:RNA polymerase sigma-70 factor (ECF subfamily)